ncbi:hypothetical protein EHQ46_15760 [Leptospira yanagawae]|uniref:DUF4328 domain-containing protein n=1 Tax=Leptospira yanagawae TaxID=293069 RepID=A0ABY2LXX0_9LEPT|nr:hypothetical protein [Leptospira yanagawae]TGL17911.1 hypothetical protein EHQ46_15760 [Leptospira yanagawae]
MLLNIVNKIPFVEALTSYSIEVHKFAWRKFKVLWFLNMAPVWVTLLLSPISDEKGTILDQFLDTILKIPVAELYIYVVSFTSPIMYLIYENRTQKIDNENSKSPSIKDMFRGYGYIVIVSLVFYILTSFSYALLTINPQFFNNTNLSFFLSKLTFFVYIFSVFCLYLTILDGTPEPNHFVDSFRKNEKAAVDSLENRLKKRKGIKHEKP